MRIIEENGKFALVADLGKAIRFGDCYCHKLYRKENDFADCTEVDASTIPTEEEELTDEPIDGYTEEATDADYEAALAEMGVEV